MDGRSKLTLGLLGTAVLAGTALGLGVGRPPRAENPGVVAVRREAEAASAAQAEAQALKEGKLSGPAAGRAAFNLRGCLTCHGSGGGGTPMGPALGEVIAEYLAETRGDRAAAKDRLVRYLNDPQGVPTLRKDPTLFPNPMPSAPKLACTPQEIDAIAEFVLDMKPPSMAVGGDASGR